MSKSISTALLFVCAMLAGCGSRGGDGGKSDERPTTGPADDGRCVMTTPAQWTGFLKTVSDDESWVATCEDSTCDQTFFDAVKTDVKDVLDRCAPFIDSHPKIAACTKNLRRFVPSWMQQHDQSSYGFTVDNKTYLAAEVAADRPAGMMTPPPEIVAALPDPHAVEEAARTNGWRYVTHDSALGSAGVGARTFIYKPDPAGRFDQWMLLNLSAADPTKVNTTIPLSFIGVQKTDAAGQPLARIRVNFRDYTIDKAADGALTIDAREDAAGKCYSCHPSGLRQLINFRTPILAAKPVKGEPDYDPAGLKVPDDFGFKRLQELNAVIRSYGLPDWNGQIVPEDHGPALGAEQGCTSCHDGTTRGRLTVSTSTDQLEKKIYYQLSMPPEPAAARLLEGDALKKPPLTASEQAQLQALQTQHDALTTAFEDARFPTLQTWLTAESCE